jgi:type 1 glutamine amidotransferase
MRPMRSRLRLSTAFLATLGALALALPLAAQEKIRVLLLDGQNNHAWQETTPLLVSILEGSGRFSVAVSTSPPAAPRGPRPPQNPDEEAKAKFAAEMKAWEAAVAAHKESAAAAWEAWRPDFGGFDVVVSNYNGEPWPESVREALEAFVSGGGGFVPVHAANNAFPEWPAYNEMIGVGGWGGRSELSGPYLRKREGRWTLDRSEGRGGSHGRQHEFVVETQAADHPIVRGLPAKWLHAQDELYDRLRGPARDVTVLAAAFASEETGGSGEWEPLLMALSYGKGRVFHTALGHSVVSMGGLGFQETLKRGVEWAATGEVTFPEVGAEQLTLEAVAVAP